MRGDAPSRRFGAGLVALVGLALAIRVGYIVWVAPTDLGADAAWYRLVAEGLATGHGYSDPSTLYWTGVATPTATFPPLWPMLLSLPVRLGIDDHQALSLVGALAGSVTVGLAGLLGRRVAGPSVGLVAAAVVASSPLLIAADGSLMSEPLYVALITLALLLAYGTQQRPTWWRFTVLGLVVGLATLTRSEGILVGGAILAVTVLRSPLTWGPRFHRTLVASLAVLAVLTPWTVRNVDRFDDPVLLSMNSGSLLEGANCASTYEGAQLGGWDYECLTAVRDGVVGSTEASTSARRGLDHVRDNLDRLPVVAGARALRTWGLWNPAHLLDAEVVETRDRGWHRIAWAAGLATTAAAACGAAVAARKRFDILPLAAVIGAVTATAILSWGNQRFRAAAEPALAVLVGIALLEGWRALRRRAWPMRDPTTSRS